TFAALFHAGIAKGVLMRFWGEVRRQLPVIEGARDRRPEDLLTEIAKAADGQLRPGALLQQLGCLVLVGSVGVRGAGAIMSRHCSARSWQRYKRKLKAVPEAGPDRFCALRAVDEAIGRFKPLCMADFRESSPTASMSPHMSFTTSTGRNSKT
ncbi:MAG: hypothetical protein RLN70_06860, partial [Rhodospirillaceae bacterium]